MKSGTKLKVQDLLPFKCLSRYESPYYSLTLLAKLRAKRKQVFQVGCLSEDSFISSNFEGVRFSRTRGTFPSGGVISLGRQVFSEPLNILLVSISSNIYASNDEGMVKSGSIPFDCKH